MRLCPYPLNPCGVGGILLVFPATLRLTFSFVCVSAFFAYSAYCDRNICVGDGVRYSNRLQTCDPLVGVGVFYSFAGFHNNICKTILKRTTPQREASDRERLKEYDSECHNGFLSPCICVTHSKLRSLCTSCWFCAFCVRIVGRVL